MTIWSKRNGHWKQVSGTSQADKSAIWGRISGSIRSQTDLIDILDTLQRDLNNVKAEYLDRFNLTETQLIRSRTDFEREPLIRTVSPGDVEKDNGRHAVNCATMKRDAVMKEGPQDVPAPITFTGFVHSRTGGWNERYDDTLVVNRDMLLIIGTSEIIGAYGAYGNAGIETLDPGVKALGISALNGSGVTKIDGDVYYFGSKSCANCAKLKSIRAPHMVSVGNNGVAFSTALQTADFGGKTERNATIGVFAFGGDSVLATLVLRYPRIVTLASANAFDSTPIKTGTGYVYVPDELVEQYKTATNWIVYANQIKAISELPPEASA